jgi:glycosyltransferase involved in cell wall biosynthesis
MPVFFSIIIPTYNRAHLINDTIQSVLQQDYNDYELIIIDDGSNDLTGEVVSRIIEENKDKRIFYYYKENGERAAARNYGLKKAKGDYVNFFDSDDVLYSDHLSEANRVISNSPHTEIFHLRYEVVNEKGKKISEGPVLSTPANALLIEGNFLSCNGVFIKREIALQNLFNEDRQLSGVEDWELWLRLGSKYAIQFSNKITSAIINHDERSVLAANKEKLVTRMSLLIKYVLGDPAVAAYYKSAITKFKASCYSYISLHLALNKIYKKDALAYLLKTIRIMPLFIMKKRFFAILKHLY